MVAYPGHILESTKGIEIKLGTYIDVNGRKYRRQEPWSYLTFYIKLNMIISLMCLYYYWSQGQQANLTYICWRFSSQLKNITKKSDTQPKNIISNMASNLSFYKSRMVITKKICDQYLEEMISNGVLVLCFLLKMKKNLKYLHPREQFCFSMIFLGINKLKQKIISWNHWLLWVRKD